MKTFTLLCLLLIGVSGRAQTFELFAPDCGATMNLINQTFRCNSYNFVTEYEFTFVDQAGGPGAVITQNNHTLTLAQAGLPAFGKTYDVTIRVKTITSAGLFTTAGPAGGICTLSSPGGPPATQLVNCVSTNPVAQPVFNSLFLCNAVNQASAYDWEFSDPISGTVITTVTSTTNKMSLAIAGLFSANTIYDVKVRATVNGVTPAFGTACQVKAPSALPSTQLSAAFCNLQLAAYNQNFQATSVAGASEYEFTFTNTVPGGATVVHTSPTRTTNLAAAGINTPFASFDVTVRARLGTISPAVFSNVGASCVLFTPTIVPLIKLDVASCGLQTSEFADAITSETVQNATAYRFIFEDLTNGLPLDSITTSGNSTSLLALLGNDTIPNNTYRVKVKAEVAGNFGTYGLGCLVFSKQTVPVPALIAQSCGTTLTSFVQSFFSSVVPGASEYTFRFTPPTGLGLPAFIDVVDNNQSGKLLDYGLLTAGITYDVQVKAQLNGVYGAFGAVCQLTAPQLQTTGITNCGALLSGLNTNFTTQSVPGATEYEYEFVNGGTTTTFVKNFHTTNLLEAGLLEVGVAYQLRVRAKVGGVFGNYGSACTLTAPATVPTTTLTTASCGSTAPGYTSIINAIAVAGADMYVFEYTIPGTFATVTDTNTIQQSSFQQAGITNQNAVIPVRVKAKIGSTWGTFGASCDVTTPNVPAAIGVNNNDQLSNNATKSGTTGNTLSDASIDFANVELNVYPNPSSDVVNIATNLNNFKVAIYSTNGKMVYNADAFRPVHTVTLNDFAEGMYVVYVTDTNGVLLKSSKLVVTK